MSFFYIQNVFSSPITPNVRPKSFSLSAGVKTIILPKSIKLSPVEWSNFCFDEIMGCARFQIKQSTKEPSFGFIKVITNKIEKNQFKKYCKDTFDISKSLDNTLTGFLSMSETAQLHCSWMGLEDKTHFFWKDGITLLLTTSDKLDISKIISEAKINEK
jgi:hypothetical protein